MKTTRQSQILPTVLLALGLVCALQAGDEFSPPANNSMRDELREQLQKLPPAEREAKLKEWREKHPDAPLSWEERLKRQEELKNLSPEARQAKIKEWREKDAARRPDFKNLTPEQREAKRKEFRERMRQRATDLRKKKTDGTITGEEQKQLERMEEIEKRFDKNPARSEPRPATPEKPVGEK